MLERKEEIPWFLSFSEFFTIALMIYMKAACFCMYILLTIMKKQIIRSHSKEKDYRDTYSHGQIPLLHAQKTHLY